MKLQLPRLQRLLIGALALAACVALGVRSKPGQASPWVKSVFKGPARAALKVYETTGSSTDPMPSPYDIYAAAAYGTEISRYDHGILIKSRFPVPGTEDRAVLIVDLDRLNSRTRWDGEDSAHLAARYYAIAGRSGQVTFDANAVSGELTLEKVAIAEQSIGFRIRGYLEFVDPGADRVVDTEDDTVVEIEIVFETVPPPEAIAVGQAVPSPLPVVDSCGWPECYEDPGYYYDPYDAYYDPSCGHAGVGYSYYDYDEGSGCEGDTYVDEEGGELDGSESWDEDTSSGCESESSDSSYYDGYDDYESDGCESSSDSSSAEGCSGDSSSSGSSGCEGSDSSSSSGCGSGCEGDTFSEAPAAGPGGPGQLEGFVGWGTLVLLLGVVLGLHRR